MWHGRNCPKCVCFALWTSLVTMGGIFVDSALAGEHRVGLGVQYWQTVDEFATGDIEDDGVSFIFSYSYTPRRGLFSFQADVEYYSDGYAGSDTSAFAPVVYVVVGRDFYVSGGVGLTFSSGLRSDPSDPFYTARLGYQFDVLPGLKLDLYSSYRTNAFSELDDLDTEVYSAGLIARLKLGK